MIVSLKGKIQYLSPNHLVIDVSGIGYECMISASTYDHLLKIDKEVIFIDTYHHITDSSQSLFGFIHIQEKDMFKMLISISGIGPKIAIQIFSSVTASDLETRIISGEVSSLTSLPGIGPKTAKRIIIELKDKLLSLNDNELPIEDPIINDKHHNDAVDALIVLGYNKREIIDHLNEIKDEISRLSTSEIIKIILNKIGTR